MAGGRASLQHGDGVAQSLQGSKIALTGRVFINAQHLGDFVIAQLLKMPQDEHFTVDFVKLLERGAQRAEVFLRPEAPF